MDKENATEAAQTANLLRQDLLSLAKSDNPILAEYARSLAARFVPFEGDLERLAEVVE